MPPTGPQLLVMRHGPAEAPDSHHDDAARRLTPVGRRLTHTACEVLARVVPQPARIYTSPLARARETAELLAQAMEVEAPVATPALAPGFDRVELARELASSRLQPLAVVGHEPDLSAFVGWLLGGDALVRVEFDKGTACLTELARPGTAGLFALYPFRALCDLGGE